MKTPRAGFRDTTPDERRDAPAWRRFPAPGRGRAEGLGRGEAAQGAAPSVDGADVGGGMHES